jgi:hypothetical protein
MLTPEQLRLLSTKAIDKKKKKEVFLKEKDEKVKDAYIKTKYLKAMQEIPKIVVSEAKKGKIEAVVFEWIEEGQFAHNSEEDTKVAYLLRDRLIEIGHNVCIRQHKYRSEDDCLEEIYSNLIVIW